MDTAKVESLCSSYRPVVSRVSEEVFWGTGDIMELADFAYLLQQEVGLPQRECGNSECGYMMEVGGVCGKCGWFNEEIVDHEQLVKEAVLNVIVLMDKLPDHKVRNLLQASQRELWDRFVNLKSDLIDERLEE